MKHRKGHWNYETETVSKEITDLCIALIALAMMAAFIFWHPILSWIWCELLRRC